MSAPAERPTAPARWLFGPVPDLLLGCGVAYAILAVGLAFAPQPVTSALPAIVPGLLILLVSTPHYGATLLRVYERREDRRRYWIFSVAATGLVAAGFVAGLADAGIASLLATLYLSWSPWHYTGQNYGIAVMFLRRRGVPLEDGAKRLLYASFLLSFVLVLLVQHGPRGGAPDASLNLLGSEVVRFVPLGIPGSITSWLVPAVLVAYLGTLAGWVLLLSRAASLRDLAPALLLSVTQALWFSIPFLARFWQLAGGVEPFDWASRSDFFVWIACGHAAQYLWITSFYARATPSWSGQGAYLAKVLAAGAAVWLLPSLFVALGTSAPRFDGGYVLLVAAVVNIHHFVLDGAIWKLRNTRIGDVLIRDAAEAAPRAEARRPALRTAVWCVAGAALAASAFVEWEARVALPRALDRRDSAAAIATLDLLARFGRDQAGARHTLGLRLAASGEIDSALEQLERSAAMRPGARVYGDLSLVLERSAEVAGRRGDAARAVAMRSRAAEVAALAARLPEAGGSGGIEERPAAY